jgi:hypothetical protein
MKNEKEVVGHKTNNGEMLRKFIMLAREKDMP